ncbi:MAG: transcription elongation factor GreA [Bacteroidia bacterium]|nr:transcription elongation factor GreA [Bacteroidia bacterium]MDW8157573.1 transcription elongation factor GreA [Bacteroidia bacterium]
MSEYLTREAYKRLQDRLHEMKTKERSAIAAAIAEAREKGDLSENAEYDAAKEKQGLLEMEISKLEQLLSNSRIIDDENIDTSKVFILSTVKLKNLKDNKIVSYTLVSAQEANIREGKISVDSPMGKGLLGKKVGEKVVINAPAGLMEFEILEITR